VNGEHNRRTLSRILSQPIYRDALLFGKFIAGLITLSISLVVLWLLVIGLGLIQLGVPPSADEIIRAFIFLLIAIAYAGGWLWTGLVTLTAIGLYVEWLTIVGTAREIPGRSRGQVLHARNIWRGAVAVGMLIAEHPPHRSGRAAFPHTAPTSDV